MNKDAPIEEKIKNILEKIRSSLQADGGDIEFVGWDKKNGIVQVRLLGMCANCPMSQITLKQVIEAEMKKEMPKIKEVIRV